VDIKVEIETLYILFSIKKRQRDVALGKKNRRTNIVAMILLVFLELN
jgi:hypothetical protein